MSGTDLVEQALVDELRAACDVMNRDTRWGPIIAKAEERFEQKVTQIAYRLARHRAREHATDERPHLEGL